VLFTSSLIVGLFLFRMTYRKTSSRIIGKVKCTLVQALRLCTGRTAYRGSGGVVLLFYDHGTRRGFRVQSHAPATLYPQEEPGAYCTGGCVSPRTGLNRFGKSLPPPGFDPRTFQPAASRYTDWATQPLQQNYTYNYMSNYSCFILWLNFMLPACRPKFAAVSLIISKIERDCPKHADRDSFTQACFYNFKLIKRLVHVKRLWTSSSWKVNTR
jgi:hypothetical protein